MNSVHDQFVEILYKLAEHLNDQIQHGKQAEKTLKEIQTKKLDSTYAVYSNAAVTLANSNENNFHEHLSKLYELRIKIKEMIEHTVTFPRVNIIKIQNIIYFI